MEFGILGPLAVWQDGRELELGAAKQRALLAVLLLHAGETMSTERLVDALWDESPPATAVKALQVYVSQLRKTLGEGVVETRPLGYVLRVEDGALDLQRFERLLADGRRLLDDDEAQQAGDALREALALWRGAPLADFRYEAFARNEAGRLEELRLVALEHRLEADLAVGREAEAVPELEALVREFPLRERLRGLLILALYRTGRQADALAVVQDTRSVLREELGLDPSQALQQLEKQILVHDPSLEAAPVARTPAPAAPRAAPMPPPPTPAEVGARAQRKVVTVLFADVMGSTELGETLDPEALRTLLAAFFERMREAAERHGGVVEKFIGDAVMAVFGLPAVHEDDALRALRAAVEMREAIAELGIEGRIGVESGEVVVGTAERLVTGWAVTTAARLEQSAQAGEILVGAGAIGLGGEAVTAEPLEPLLIKGKAEPVAVWRLLSVSPEPPARHFDSPFVGRERELERLCDAWERVCAEQRCELVTVVGPAGVGKSRLVAEHLDRVEAAVVNGRCLSYGAGITYWPVLEMLAQLRASLAAVEPAVAAPLHALLDDEGAASTDEVAWAFRKLVETASRERPVALVFDDIQWAEEVLLDLIEHVAFVSSGAPVLLVCMARPELLDRRPGWRGILRLEPLAPGEAEQLVHARLGDGEADPAVAERIVAAAGGNPLFVEEMAAMVHEAGDGEIAMPPTIQALLAARLDQLDADERAVLEAGAVEGEVFHRGAVQAMEPDEPRLTAQLTALVRKEFVRPDRPALDGEDAFRFRHLLVRDATYEAIPKASRSNLHERYADWLAERSTGRDAFVGYHLEQSYRYRVELRDTGEETDALACRASEHLERAAVAALGRSDAAAAIGLLGRAAAPPPVPVARRTRLLTVLATTLIDAGKLADAERVILDTRALAGADDESSAARLLLESGFLEFHRAEFGATKAVPALTDGVIPIFTRLDDQHGLCRAWELRAAFDWSHGRVSAAQEAWERAAEHARAAGEEHRRADFFCWIASSTWSGPMPVEDGVRRCEELQREVQGHPRAEADILCRLGGLHGLAGRFELARSLFAERNAALADLGTGLNDVFTNPEALVEMLAGNFAAAERGLHTTYEAYEHMGESALRSTVAGYLARAILAQGRNEEAEELSTISEKLAAPEDLATQILWRGVRARTLAQDGLFADAVRLAREAVLIAGETEFVTHHANALVDLAALLDADGRPNDAAAAATEALRLYEEKGNVVAAGAVRAHLDALAAV